MDLAVDQRDAGHRWSLAAGLAGWGLQPITCIVSARDVLRCRRAGRIVIDVGQLTAVYGRWWPYSGDLLHVRWDTAFRGMQRDRCELYYHCPKSVNGFMTLDYVRSGAGTSLNTFYAATLVLDEIARLKQANAIVAHVTNARISDRLMERWGWQAHCLQWQGRHFIKRFYGHYPSIPTSWRTRLSLD